MSYVKNFKHILGCVVNLEHINLVGEYSIKNVNVDTVIGGYYLTFFEDEILELWLHVPQFLDDEGEIIGDYYEYTNKYYGLEK